MGMVRLTRLFSSRPAWRWPLTFSSTWVDACDGKTSNAKQHNTCQPAEQAIEVPGPNFDTTGGPPRGRRGAGSRGPTGPAGGGQPADDRAQALGRACFTA